MDSSTIQKIAKLARIELNLQEQKEFAGSLTNVVNWFNVLQEVDTENVKPLTNITEGGLRMREDKIDEKTARNIQEELLNNAPDAEYGCFAVPKVVKK